MGTAKVHPLDWKQATTTQEPLQMGFDDVNVSVIICCTLIVDPVLFIMTSLRPYDERARPKINNNLICIYSKIICANRPLSWRTYKVSYPALPKRSISCHHIDPVEYRFIPSDPLCQSCISPGRLFSAFSPPLSSLLTSPPVQIHLGLQSP